MSTSDAEQGDSYRVKNTHEKTSRYGIGCRCAACTNANRQRARRQRENRKAKRELVDGRLVATTPGLRHGAPGTYSNWGCRCQPCTDAQYERTKMRRAGAGAHSKFLRARVDEDTWAAILADLRNGTSMVDAATRHGLTTNAIFGQARIFPDRKVSLDGALIEGRDPALPHGRYPAIRAGCSCPDCRNTRARRAVLIERCDAPAQSCGTPSGWRAGGRCPRCRAAHNRETRKLRRSWSRVDQRVWNAVLRAIRSGRPLKEAADRYGVTVSLLYGQARVYPERAAQLDAALMRGRDPELNHGTARAVRSGCSCPDCRESRRRWR